METWLCFAGRHMGMRQGNLLLNHIMGATMFTTGVYGSKNLYQAMKEKAAEAEKEGKKPYTIPCRRINSGRRLRLPSRLERAGGTAGKETASSF